MDEARRLITALERFLDDATRLAVGDGVGVLPLRLALGVDNFRERMALLPSLAVARDAARDAARAHGYVVGSYTPTPGRLLDERGLNDLAIAEAVLAGRDRRLLAEEIAEHLAGPAVEIFDLVALDAAVELDGPVPVVCGWSLQRLDADHLRGLLPVPSAADLVTYQPYDVDILSQLALLRRPRDDQTPGSGIPISWDMQPAYAVWQPLLALMLFQNPVVHFYARYKVEPRRRVDRLHDRIAVEPWSPDGVVELERPFLGDWEVPKDGHDRLVRFLDSIRPNLEPAVTPTGTTQKAQARVMRLRRVTEHLIAAGENAYGHGDVVKQHNADAVLHYMVALEGLLTGDADDKSDLTRKVAQRSAVLVGHNDEARLQAHDIIRNAYRQRSAYAHGSEAKPVNLAKVRRIVRRSLLARVVLGDSKQRPLHALADEALLSARVLEAEVREPLRSFAAAAFGAA